MDDFSFEETRYINNFLHYGELVRMGDYLEKCFIPENQKLSVYNFSNKNGIIKAFDNKILKFELILEDESGNKTKERFEIKSKQYNFSVNNGESRYENKDITFIKTEKDKKIENSFYSIYIPKGTFYNDLYLNIEDKEDRLKIGSNEIPLHKKIIIKFLDTLESENKDKYYIGLKTKKGWAYNETFYNEGYFMCEVRDLGEYSLRIDTIKPKVLIGKISKKSRYLNIYSNDKDTGIKYFNAYINDKWILCEYDYKKNLFRYDFNDIKFKESRLILKVISEDYCGNKMELEKIIKR